MSGCFSTNSSIIGWVSLRLPATSRMFSSTGFDGLSGTVALSAVASLPPAESPVLPVLGRGTGGEIDYVS